MPGHRATSHRWQVLVLVTTALLAMVTPPASASPVSGPPPEIARLFEPDSLRTLQDSAAHFRGQPVTDPELPQAPDLTGRLTAAGIHEIFTFSRGFFEGKPAPQSLTASKQWIAAILRDGVPVATAIAWQPPTGPPEFGHFDDDAELATALSALTSADTLIEQEQYGRWFALRGTTVRPLNTNAGKFLADPAPLSSLQPLLISEWAAARAAAEPDDHTDIWLVAGFATVTALVGLFLVARHRS